MGSPAAAYRAEPYDYAEARAVADALGLSEPVAVTLVRRGYRTPEDARRFLNADESHPAEAFAGMDDVVARIGAAVAAGRRITIHGDFDVDGVCATALMVSTLRELDADCDWFIPDRMVDGYGLSAENVRKLAERGTSLLITVDCGVTAVEPVRLARELGMEVIVTDHHQFGEELPDCPILHPQISGYPFESLCGTAVAWKFSCALREGGDLDGDLDLVALATVADLVPLVGENRSLVKRGLAEARRGRRVGLRALAAAAKCELSELDEGDLGFRLAPRINAAGRLYRADAGVELLLTDDEGRAEQIAGELSRVNAERRATELEVDGAAETALRALPDELREAPGIVVAGEGWHPGVVGIVASRLVERHHRPTVVLSLDGEGGARGSGRSIPGFDLLAALTACAEHLGEFGGHRAAAGLSLPAANVDAFREAFVAHAASLLGPDELRRTERIDAMVGGVGLGLDLAEELGQLAPFGMGNPGVRLMVPGARVGDVRTMGEGKHARFSLRSGAHRALGVAFGRPSLGVGEEEPVDAAVRLEVNRWNGSVEPRVVLRELYPLGDDESSHSHTCECEEAEWWQRFEAELSRDLSSSSTTGLETRQSPRTIVARSGSATTAIAELVSSGAGVLAICADASRRAALASGATGLARFNGGSGRVACMRCGSEALDGVADRGAGGLALVDYATLERRAGVAAGFEHVVLVDPPPSERAKGLATAPREDASPGYLHLLYGDSERDFARAVAEATAPSRATVAAVFRRLRDAGRCKGAELRQALAGDSPHPLSPETAARCFRMLAELGLTDGKPNCGDQTVGVVSSEGTDLERSPAFNAYGADLSEVKRFLESSR